MDKSSIGVDTGRREPIYKDIWYSCDLEEIQTIFEIGETNGATYTAQGLLRNELSYSEEVWKHELTVLNELEDSLDFRIDMHLNATERVLIRRNSSTIMSYKNNKDVPVNTSDIVTLDNLQVGEKITIAQYCVEDKDKYEILSRIEIHINRWKTVQTGTKVISEAKEIKAIYVGGPNNNLVTIQQVLANRGGKKVLFEYCKHLTYTNLNHTWSTNHSTCTMTGTCSKCGKPGSETVSTSSYYSGGTYCTSIKWLNYTATFSQLTTKTVTDSIVDSWGYSSHNEGSGTVTKQATCSETGTKKYYCTRSSCGYLIRTETIPKTAHSYGESMFLSAATCTKAQQRLRTCTVCNYNDVTSVGSPLGHSTTSRVIKEATCIEDGTREYYCTRCNEVTGTAVIPATGVHDWKYYSTTKTCKICNLTV